MMYSFHIMVLLQKDKFFPVSGSNLERKAAIMKQSRTDQTRIVAPSIAVLTCLLQA